MPTSKRASVTPPVRPPLPVGASPAGAPTNALAPRSSAATVSDDVWAKAIHAVKVQKMSLRSAAQLYGVHHMSLHRRVRGRYATSVAASFDIRSFLSEADEAEVLGVLREQFLHEKRITSDDIRFVVRAIASHGGKRAVPPEFPPSRWIVDFKRAHGFAKLNSYAYPPAPPSTRGSSASDGGDMDDGDSEDASVESGSRYAPPQAQAPLPRFVAYRDEREGSDGAHRLHAHGDERYEHESHRQQQQQTQQHHSAYERERLQHARDAAWDEPQSDGDREEYGSTASYDVGGATTGSSVSSFESGAEAAGGASDKGGAAASKAQSSSSSSSQQQQSNGGAAPERTYKLSHTVAPETWEKAIAAVEQQGMSLRAAARAYGVHFAALHRRVKKRAQGDAAAPLEGYFHPDDEAGIVRVVVARAELGVLMSFDELMDLVQRAALRNLPDISVDAARKLMARFQHRNEHAIRQIVVDWPLPRISAMSLGGKGAADAASSAAATAAAAATLAQRLPRTAVIVTNTSGELGGVRPPLSFGAPMAPPSGGVLPPARLPPPGSLGNGQGSPLLPLRGELPSPHSLFLRAPAPLGAATPRSMPTPPLPPAPLAPVAAKRGADKSSSVMFV